MSADREWTAPEQPPARTVGNYPTRCGADFPFPLGVHPFIPENVAYAHGTWDTLRFVSICGRAPDDPIHSAER
jgi:hypothetical protein